jgi:hypothetical protein
LEVRERALRDSLIKDISSRVRVLCGLRGEIRAKLLDTMYYLDVIDYRHGAVDFCNCGQVIGGLSYYSTDELIDINSGRRKI